MFDCTRDAEVVIPRIPLYVGAECIGHAWGVDNLTRTPQILRDSANANIDTVPPRDDGGHEDEPPIDDEEGSESGWDYLRHNPEYDLST